MSVHRRLRPHRPALDGTFAALSLMAANLLGLTTLALVCTGTASRPAPLAACDPCADGGPDCAARPGRSAASPEAAAQPA